MQCEARGLELIGRFGISFSHSLYIELVRQAATGGRWQARHYDGFLSSLLLSAVGIGVIDDMSRGRLEGQAETGRKMGSEPR